MSSKSESNPEANTPITKATIGGVVFLLALGVPTFYASFCVYFYCIEKSRDGDEVKPGFIRFPYYKDWWRVLVGICGVKLVEVLMS